MGSLHAAEFANFAAEGQIDLDMALHWHLTSNHYPPIPAMMVPLCKEAINHANLGHFDTDLDLPEGVRWKGQDTAPVHAIIDQHHLESFLDSDDWDDEWDEEEDYIEDNEDPGDMPFTEYDEDEDEDDAEIDTCSDCGRVVAAGFDLCIRCEQL